MAIRTANKRAYLYGEGEKRQEWGISTVKVNSRLGGCHLCTKYIGKVFIDDVYSGGKKSDGDYPLLSEAIKGGLFHPNCKDGLSTYFEGISTLSPVTDEEREELDRRRKLEAQKNYYDNQAEKCDRISKHSLDKENKHIYKTRAETCKQKADEIGGKLQITENNDIDYMSKRFKPKFTQHKPIVNGNRIIEVKRVSNSRFDVVTDIENSHRNKAIRLTEKLLAEIDPRLPNGFRFPKIAVIDFDKHNFDVDAIGGYDNKTGVLYLNSKYDTAGKIIEFITACPGMFANNTVYAPIMHELGHKYYYDSIKLLAKDLSIDYNKAQEVLNVRIYDYIHLRNVDGAFLLNNLSFYASNGYAKGKYTEIIAEAFSILGDNKVSQDLIDLLRRELC